MSKQKSVCSWQYSGGSEQYTVSSTQLAVMVPILSNWKWLCNLLLLGVIFLSSCVEKIDFPLNRGVEKLIVAGQVNDLDETQFIYLSETTSRDREPLLSGAYFVINDLPRPVIGANVMLKSSGGRIWTYSMTKPGTYELPYFGGLVAGESYYVEISVEGRVYRSEPELFNSIIGTDKLSYTFDRGVFKNQPETGFISIQTEVTLPEQVGDYYLRWDVDEVYFWDLTFFPNPFNKAPPLCFVYDFPDPERITLLNGDLLNRPGGVSTQVVAERIVDQSFLSRHYFNIRQTSISKPAYEYWRKVRELVNNTGSVFDTPPAPIRGNVNNVNDADEVVLGYIEIANVDVTRIFTTKADVPFFIEEVCTYSPTRRLDDYPKTCLFCSEFKNSSGEYPLWWFDP